ncbi:MAG: helix-turn-helix domain-containing protein [Patescibacteria group bacterium]
MIQDILRNIGISETASRVYLHLLENGVSSARQIAEHISIPRTSVYDNLKILINSGLVVEENRENKRLFRIDDVKNISHLVRGKIEDLQKQDKNLKAILPTLGQQKDYLEPKIKFYSGTEGVKHVLNDILWYENIETMTVWPISEMLNVLGADYLEEHNRKRIRRGIGIRAIWPQDKAVKFGQFPFLSAGKDFLREIRVAPKGQTWSMGYWLYADKVAFISSRQESFGFIVHSRDFMETINAQFELVWPLCKKTEDISRKDAASFLKTI